MSKESRNKKNGLWSAINSVFTGRILVSPVLAKNWPFILYLSVLALIMIGSSHKADSKVYQISRLRSQVKELNSEYLDTRSRLMIESMEYKVVERAQELGLKKNEVPPIKIHRNEKKK